MQESQDASPTADDPYRPPVDMTLPQEAPDPLVGKRPALVAVLCGWSSFQLAGLVVFVFNRSPDLATGHRLLLGIPRIVMMAIFIHGLWKMKRWPLLCYLPVVGISQAKLISTGRWAPESLLIPLVSIVIIGVYYKRMR